ncbi:MAG: DUF547 domain-containing protein [Alphaproteobacteria bacterium]
MDYRILISTVFILLLGAAIGALGFRFYLSSFEFEKFVTRSDNLLQVDHSSFQKILDSYLETSSNDNINRFDYRSAINEKATLRSYIAGLEKIDPALLSDQEALAYWINFYNAGMIFLVLELGEFTNVDRNKPYFFLTNHFEVMGTAISLDHIENQIIRRQWDEPRIHYALNCASLSCPNLQALVFEGNSLNSQLDYAATEYINHPRGVGGLEGKRLGVSQIYNWFSQDFGSTDAETIQHISSYTDNNYGEAQRLRFIPYDWSLNIILE